MFDVRLIQSFLAVATHRHFGKAAEAVHATQPGISQHIAKLEDQLGFQLLERTKRSVVLTAAGEYFFEQSALLVRQLERIRQEGLEIAEGKMGHINMGIASSLIYSELTGRIAEFKRQTPNVALSFAVHGGDRLRHLMDTGEIDLAITTMPMTEEQFRPLVISTQAMGVALPAAHPLAARDVVTLAELKEESFIVVPRRDYPLFHDTLVAKFQAMGSTLRIAAYETPFLNAIARVAIGEGVAIVAIGYGGDSHDAVRVVPLADDQLASMPVYAVVRSDRPRSSIERLLEVLSAPRG
jgi:DNA-binding transcriptional LysR family regulator